MIDSAKYQQVENHIVLEKTFHKATLFENLYNFPNIVNWVHIWRLALVGQDFKFILFQPSFVRFNKMQRAFIHLKTNVLSE